MRIVIDASLPLSPASGTFRYVAQLVRAMNQTGGGHDVVVLTAADTEAALTELAGSPAGVEFVSSGGDGKLRKRLAHTRRCVRRIRPDVLHSPGYFAPAASRVPTVVTVHDLNFLVRFSDWMRAGNALRSARLSAHIAELIVTAKAVIVPSEHTGALLGRWVPPLARRTHVIRHAAPDAPGRPPAFANRAPLALSVGVLAPQKNLPTAVRAFARALRALPRDAEYRLIGRDAAGYWPKTLAPLVKELGIENRVHFVGQVDDDELAMHYRQARALLFVSRGEGYGLPATESQAHGLPVIGSSTTAITEATGGVAVLVDPDDMSAIASELTRLMSDEMYWTTLSLAGRSQASRSWSEVAAEHFAVYEAVARG